MVLVILLYRELGIEIVDNPVKKFEYCADGDWDQCPKHKKSICYGLVYRLL